ncbi:MAG: hypothetical protein JO189_05525 [Deltaproteobacteria bacterium]|nr:hypothetical protein [Deltaproteobacteria bacterium]
MTINSIGFESFARLGESLGELEITIGPVARPVIAEVRTRLAQAAGRQKNGDIAGAIAIIRGAMERLASLAGTLDPAEAVLMRMLSEHFTNALSIGDKNAAKDTVNLMRHKAGDPEDEPNTDW